jgi:hypothetical protein
MEAVGMDPHGLFVISGHWMTKGKILDAESQMGDILNPTSRIKYPASSIRYKETE